MKIGIDARLTYYRTGGISSYIRHLITALEQLVEPKGVKVLNSWKSSAALSRTFQQVPLFTPCHHRIERLSMSVELSRLGLDVLHSPDFIPPLHGARRHVITIHDLNFLHYPQFLTAESRRYYNGQIQAAVRKADHILADSEATRQDIVNMLNVPPDKITVHMLGVDNTFQPPDAASLQLHKHTLSLPDRYLLFLGTFEPRKNILGLLEAYRLLLKQIPDAPPMILAGSRGWLFEETMARINQMGLEKHIRWIENVDQKSLPALYNLADALVTPSFYEGFGLPALEAMACGTVPIVSNRSSLPEVVGDVGLQVNPDDPEDLANALFMVLTNDSWREQQEHAGLLRAAGFQWSNTAQIALNTYKTVQ